MRRFVAWAATLVIGLAIGAGSAWWALQAGGGAFTQHMGQWSWSRAAGSIDAGPYTRAIVARNGLLALSADEALYLNLDRDENGKPLREDCVYELSGGQIPARWWSVTLYAPDNYLAENNDGSYSIDSTHVAGDPNGQWTARISSVRGEAAHWISSRAARHGFSLTLRAYNADDGFPADASVLPSLRTISCPDAPP